MWRLVLSDTGLDYNTVFHQMTPDEINEANIALDDFLKAQQNASKKGR